MSIYNWWLSTFSETSAPKQLEVCITVLWLTNAWTSPTKSSSLSIFDGWMRILRNMRVSLVYTKFTLLTLIACCRLLWMNVKLSNCRGQCYDGSSNMCGAHNGVATKLLQEESRALYTHCYAHTLNLAVADTIKKSKLCRDALDTAFEVTRLIKFSPTSGQSRT